MAAEGENKIFGKDWFADFALFAMAAALVGIFIEIMKGKCHRWGEQIHGHRHDGSHVEEYPYSHHKHKAKKAKKENTEEKPEEKSEEESEEEAA